MVARDRMLDYGLSALVAESDTVFLCTDDPATWSDANTTHVGVKSGSRGSMFYALSSPPGGGRMASLAGFNNGDITSNGMANYVVVADSVLGNILISEALVAPQMVITGGKFAINAMDIVLGRSAQPQPASLTVSSPVIGTPVFIPSGYGLTTAGLTPSSPVIGSPTLVWSGSGWFNTPTANETGTFVCEFDAVPTGQLLDCAIGLSDVVASSYPQLATIILFTADQFNPGNIIQVRNGNIYDAVNTVNYTAGISYHFRMIVNVTAHTYSVYVTPANTGTEVTVATNYAFRAEKQNITSIDTFVISTGDVGTVVVTNLTVGGLDAVDLTTGSPVIARPLLNNKVGLSAFSFAPSSPVLGTPAAVIAGGYNNLAAWPDATNRPQYSAGVLTWIGPLAGGPSTANDVQQSIVLSSSGSRTLSTPNQTISGLDIAGTVLITASGVTLRRCRITSNATSVVDINSGVSGTVIEDCLIDGTGTQTFTNGGFGIRHLGSGTATVRRNFITRTGNAVSPGSSGPWNIIDNYVDNLLSGGGPHYDCIPVDGVNDQLNIIHNNMINDFDQTSVIIIDNYWGPVSNVVVDNNRLIGGGYTVYDNSNNPGTPNSNIQITNNLMGKGSYNYTNFGPVQPTFIGNVDYITGQPIVPPMMNDATFTIPLNSPVGTVIGTLSVTGMNPTSPLYWHPLSMQSYFAVTTLTGQIRVAATPPAGTYQFFLEVDNDANQSVTAYVNIIVSNSTSTVKNLIANALAASSPIIPIGAMNNKIGFSVGTWTIGRPALGQPPLSINSAGGYDNLSNWPSAENRPIATGNTLNWIGPVNGGPSTSSDTPQSRTLTNVSGTVVLTTPNSVYEGRNVAGILRIAANNITVRRCKIKGGGNYTFSVDHGVVNAVIEDCEIAGPNSGSGTILYTGNTPDGEQGPLGSAATFRRCYIHNAAQGLSVGYGPLNVIDCWFLMDVTDGTHAECVQINGTPLGQLNFTHNWMEITLNQSFNFLVTDFYGTIQNVFCDNNVFIGSASSGVISFNNSNAGAQAINCIFTNNYLSRGNGSGGFFYTDNNKPGQGWTCNTYHNNRNWDTNAIIASPSGQT